MIMVLRGHSLWNGFKVAGARYLERRLLIVAENLSFITYNADSAMTHLWDTVTELGPVVKNVRDSRHSHDEVTLDDRTPSSIETGTVWNALYLERAPKK